MELLVAYQDDPAGHNMAKFLSKEMNKEGNIFHGKFYDLIIISTPAISADWLEEKYDYDGFVFLSKHAAESGVLALTCHCTGNFSEAKFGGNERQVAVPHPHLQKAYLQTLKKNQAQFSELHKDTSFHCFSDVPISMKIDGLVNAVGPWCVASIVIWNSEN